MNLRLLLAGLSLMLVALLGGCSGETEDGESLGSISQNLCTGVKLTASPPGPQNPGTSVVLSASGATCAGGETPEYRFLYIKDGTSTAVQIRAYGTAPSTAWSTVGLASGAYQVVVYARAVGSTAAYQSVGYLNPNYLIGNVCNTTTSFTTTPASPQPVGAQISLTSTATCTGGTAEHRYAYRAPGSASYVYIGAYGAATQNWNTTGLPAGAYSLVVFTRAVGNTSSSESVRYATYTLGVGACTNAALNAAPASPQPAGTQVTLTGSAMCGSPQFRFSYRLFGNPGWINIGTWGGATATWNTTGLSSGVYQLLVEVRQTGSAGAAESTSIIGYTLGDVCGAVTLGTAPPSPQGVGVTVSLTGAATCSGAATPEYQFSYRAPGSNTFTLISAYGAASTADWNTTGLPLGAYTLRVESRAVGSTSPYESAASTSYTLTTSALTGVAAGLGNHVCARANDGTARCWGANDVGQLGTGSTSPMSTTPVAVTGLSNVASVIAGGFHSCALLLDGTVRCWGENSDGQLGNNSNTPSASPVVVSGLTDAVGISVGTFHACALRSGGTVACWGSNSYFATGSEVAGDWPQTKVPATLPGIAGATAVYAGGFHSCALVSGGIKCWGDNSLGQLGNGGMPTKSITPVDVTGLTSGVTSMGSGDSHSCAVVGGAVQCWGDNQYGQIGNGSSGVTPVLTPSAVAGLSTVAEVGAGFTFSCARLNNRTVRCWGRNGNGELGDGTGVDSFTPTTVTGITNASSLTTGALNACIIPLSGPARCWGYGGMGALGNGTSGTDALSPVAVSFP